MDDEMFWELLEEQHAHDVYVTWERNGKEDEDGRPDKQTGGD